MGSFEGKAARLQRIESGQEQYGPGDRKEQATRFYLDEMLDEIVERAAQRSNRRPRTPVRLLISLAGFSPITTVLVYRLLKPQRMLVVTSLNAQSSIDVIGEQVIGAGRLRHQDFRHAPVVPTDPLGIYRVVRTELEELEKRDEERPYAVIDITGGRKVMSAAAALAAWQLGLDLCYIDSDYDPARLRPVPGSDRLLLLDNPTALFGEQSMSAALEMFANGAFESARQRYDELCEIVAEPGRARFMRALSELYRAWCDLDLTALPQGVRAVEKALHHVRHDVSAQTARRLERQLTFLHLLAEGDHDSLLVCFFVLGEHYRDVGRHDFAALLYYRAIEGCLAGRLERLAAGFSCGRPDYTVLTADPEGLRARYVDIQRSLGRKDADGTLPPVIGLMSAAVLLAALDDDMLRSAQLSGPKALSHLNSLATTRNKSVLAHGSATVGAKESQTLGAKARAVLRGYWSTLGTGDDVAALCEELKFVRTDR
ncbi:TIGR02710 family CRISPR-associated CARF protein [Streptomyces umbrinus]|uniref:TIGR02710 family CRISPR-associated CARF protein n=1 Tax=Streptomyces umbrinus TaxID=67370 RepID=UPI0027D7E967|nr:TIGR02710 family CRISPR-associated CARF protein [Streptomyces umbrinus]